VAFRQKHTRDQKRELVLRAFEQRPELTFTKLKQLTGLTTSPLSRTLERMERRRSAPSS
jgi:DNA-binding MarR family transcriptional regulator